MKRFFIGVIVVLLMFVCTPTSASAATIAELQAMIASLTAQLNILLSQQITMLPTIGIINPTATSTGMVSFKERPVLKLVYDSSRNESKLEASAVVSVYVGAQDVLISSLELAIMDSKGVYFNTRAHAKSIAGITGATQVYSDTYGTAWLVKANTNASFKLISTENPQVLFAGTYTTSLYPAAIIVVNTTGSVNKKELAYENTKSLPVTIVGEKSPYLSGSDFKGTNVMISGFRFSRGDKVYVNNVRKGVLTDVSRLNNNLINGAFPISWLDKSEKGGCTLYGIIQIENEKYGKSNGFYVSKDCGNSNLTVKYDMPITSPYTGDNWGLNDDKVIHWTYPNELAGKLVNLTVKLQTPDESKGWVFDSESVIVANPSLGQGLGAGIPWDRLSHLFPNGIPAGPYNILITADDLSTNISHRGVNGQFNVVGGTTMSPTVLYPNGGEILTLAKDTFLVTFQPLYGKTNSVELIGSDGNVYNLGSFTGEATDKQAVGIDTAYMSKLGVRNGSYKVRVCLNLSDQYDLLCDTSDTYFTINSPTPVTTSPFVSVFSPSAGEALATGQNYRIKWTNSPNIDKVTIGYSFGEGSLNWFANNSANNIPNNGYYDWNVNIGNTTNSNSKARLCITGYQTGVGSVSSCSGYFTVSSPTVAMPIVTSPATVQVQPTVEVWGPWVVAKQSSSVYVGDMAQFISTRSDMILSYSCGIDGAQVSSTLNSTAFSQGTFYCTYSSAGPKVVSISQNGKVLVSKTIEVLPAIVSTRAQQLSSLAASLQALKDALKAYGM